LRPIRPPAATSSRGIASGEEIISTLTKHSIPCGLGGIDCTAYDCEFVALSKRTGIPLVTADAQLLKVLLL
jgi:predicted nucleic acid-binding protein